MAATNGKAWREKSVQEITFTTGNVAKVRKPDIMGVISDTGDIPDVFIEVIQKIDFDSDSISNNELLEVVKELPKLWRYVDRLVVAAFVEPRIVDNPSADDEIALSDVDISEKIEVFTWVMKGVAPLVQLGSSFLKKS